MGSAVRNAETMMKVDFATAVRMASESPARAIGLRSLRGIIGAGAHADLVLMDADKQVVETWINGVSERV
jgi:N-acetylglucosamine-6-phosphate deacetylase